MFFPGTKPTNRTNLELKLSRQSKAGYLHWATNRTNLELKRTNP